MNIIYSLILTLIIELTISFALGIKKCDLLRILIINILCYGSFIRNCCCIYRILLL